MSNADVSRAANSAVDAASAGLEKYFETLQERVVSLLAHDRASFTKTLEDVQTMLGAVAIEQRETRNDANRGHGELLSGLQGVAQDMSEVSASVQEATARLGKLSADVGSLATRLSTLEVRMQESQSDRQSIHDEVAALRASFEEYKAGSRRNEFEQRLTRLEARSDGE